jgi:hypothetical protein
MTQTLLLGIGCQKGGTTWLHEYLARHPQVAQDPVTELLVLDVAHVPYFSDFHDSKSAFKRELIANLGKEDSERAARRRERLAAEIEGHERSMAMVRDPRRYTEHLRRLADSDPAIRLVRDITPSYAALDAAHWQQARRDLEDAGFDLRLVFIMRDPIDRLFSAYRMGRRRSEDFNNLAAAASPLEAARARLRPIKASLMELMRRRPQQSPFLEFALEEMNLRRSQYERTVTAVEAAFPAEHLHCVLFEDFFNEAALRRFTDFAGIDFMPTEYAKTVETRSAGAELVPADVAELRDRLDATYRFGAERFGADTVAARWRHH